MTAKKKWSAEVTEHSDAMDLEEHIFEADDDTAAHIPPAARSVLSPLSADGARGLRAQLLKKMNR